MSELAENFDAPDIRSAKAGFRPAALDALNFLLADVRGALGPYLNVFLVTQQHWSQSQVGLVTTMSGLLGLSLQTPIGAAIDETHAKRGIVVLALAVLAIGAAAIFAVPSFWPVAVSNSLMAIAGDVFGPAVAALTLGLYARKQLARRMGRNQPSTMPATSLSLCRPAPSAMPSPSAPFFFSSRSSPCSRGSPCSPSPPPPLIMSGREIWRRLEPRPSAGQDRRLKRLVRVPSAGRLRLVRHAVSSRQCGAAAAGGTKAGRRLSRRSDRDDVGLHYCGPSGHVADRAPGRPQGRCWGRKPLFLAGFAILPIRAALYTFSDNGFWLIGVQIFDGVGAGIFGALTPLVIADIMRGTGRYNLAQARSPQVGIGASLSGLAAGEIVDHFGYAVAFLSLGAVAALALIVFAVGMPETANHEQ